MQCKELDIFKILGIVWGIFGEFIWIFGIFGGIWEEFWGEFLVNFWVFLNLWEYAVLGIWKKMEGI